jgi:5-methyltetrahydropteroyltriglutamate--homocysteine methyltransferase
MKRSTERVLTTQVGSLARPEPLLRTMQDKEHGRPYDPELFAQQVREAVADVVRLQAAAGLDVVTDGEQGKVNFHRYVTDRLSGFSATEGQAPLAASWEREIQAFPEYYEEYFRRYTSTVTPRRMMVCDGPIAYVGHEAVQADIDNLRSALDGLDVEEAFLPSTSPRSFGTNEHYDSEQEYLYAIADALREEYRAIVDAGLVLQVDDPELGATLTGGPGADPQECRRAAAEHVELLNHALRGIPAERVRLHTCYGINHGPRVSDLPLRDVVDLMLEIDAGAYSFEAANPRHQHEWRIWEEVASNSSRISQPGG